MNRVILSTDSNHDYSFFMPITSWLWRKFGYEPINIIVGDELTWKNDKKLSIILKKTSGDTNFIPEIEGHKNSTVAQCARLFGHLFANKGDYCLTADMDMLPLSKEYFQQGNKETIGVPLIDLYGADLYQKTRFPICYIGMVKELWEKVMGNTLQANLPQQGTSDWDAWNWDETLFYGKAIDWDPYFHYIDRGTELSGLPIGRVDRSDEKLFSRASLESRPQLIDCHMLRYGFSDNNFGKMIELLTFVLPHEDLTWIHDYREAYINI